MRRSRLSKHLVCVLALAALALSPVALATAEEFALSRDGDLLTVRAPAYRITIDPHNGARVMSLIFRDAEMTRAPSGGHGGLMEELHTADLPHSLAQTAGDDGKLSLRFVARTDDLKVEKTYRFWRDRAWFAVDLAFTNESPYALSGRAAPALRSTVLPAQGYATGRELYCMERGMGAEILPARLFASRLCDADDSGRLEWMAVSEPTSRRALGFALAHSGCRPLEPVRTEDGAMTIGWSYPDLPPGRMMKTRVLVVPLEGLTAVSELTPRLVAESLCEKRGDAYALRLNVMPLKEELKHVSVVTRVYDAEGKEFEPWDTMLFKLLRPGVLKTAQTTAASGSGEPAWLLHEVYARGDLVDRFAAPLGRASGPAPFDLPRAPPPEPIQAGPATEPLPGAQIPQSEAQKERGFVVWRLEGPAARQELKALKLELTRGERETLFLGVRSLREVQDLRFSASPMPQLPDGYDPLPAPALGLWRVEDAADGGRLAPLQEVEMGAQEVVWFALTVDAAQVGPGAYAARLAFTAESGAQAIALRVEVIDRARPAPEAFGLWYAGPWSKDRDIVSTLGQLQGYGVCAVTLPRDRDVPPAHKLAAAGMLLEAFSAGGGTLPPAGTTPERQLLRVPYPLWFLRADTAEPTAAQEAARSGYVPALLCESLKELRGGLPPEQRRVVLVEQGCEVGAAPRLVKSGALRADEPVWLYLDLRGADWRRAALQLRSTLWAAAWQGYAGVAVRAAAPSAAADRQLALWHILRDTREEVALWREARSRAARLHQIKNGESGLPLVTLISLEALEATVGPAPQCKLRLQPTRTDFRRLYRVAPQQGEAQVRLSQFRRARSAVFSAVKRLCALGPACPPEGRFWQDVPLGAESCSQWTIVAPAGEKPWKIAKNAQSALRRRCGVQVKLQREFPDIPDDGSRQVIWLIDGEEAESLLPQTCRELAKQRRGRPVVIMEPEGAIIALLRDAKAVDLALGLISGAAQPFTTAGQMR